MQRYPAEHEWLPFQNFDKNEGLRKNTHLSRRLDHNAQSMQHRLQCAKMNIQYEITNQLVITLSRS